MELHPARVSVWGRIPDMCRWRRQQRKSQSDSAKAWGAALPLICCCLGKEEAQIHLQVAPVKAKAPCIILHVITHIVIQYDINTQGEQVLHVLITNWGVVFLLACTGAEQVSWKLINAISYQFPVLKYSTCILSVWMKWLLAVISHPSALQPDRCLSLFLSATQQRVVFVSRSTCACTRTVNSLLVQRREDLCCLFNITKNTPLL